MTPLVSVIIPTYNHDRKLKRAIMSVLDQTFNDFEIIIVDNHSTDETDAVVGAFDDNRISLFKINNKGVIAVSRNVGIRHAKGQYLAFLDSDDWWTEDKLERSLEKMDEGCDVVYHDLWLVSKENQRSFQKKVGAWQVRSPVYDCLLVNGNAIPNSSVMVRAGLLSSTGIISEDADLKGVEDFDFWLRLAKSTERFCCLPGTLGYYWYGGGNFSGNSRALLTGLRKLEQIHYTHYSDSHGGIPLSPYIATKAAKAAYKCGEFGVAQHYLGLLKHQPLPLLQKVLVNLISLWIKLVKK